MKLKILSVCALVWVTMIDSHIIVRRQATTESPNTTQELEDDSTDDYDCPEQPELSERALMAANYFPENMPRERVLKMLKRAVSILEKPPRPSKMTCRRDVGVEIDAKNTLRFLTGDPTVGSTSEDSSQNSACIQSGEEYQPDVFTVDNQRRISDQTVKKILQIVDRGASEKTIRAQYSWFRRQYIPRMRRYDQAGGLRTNASNS